MEILAVLLFIVIVLLGGLIIQNNQRHREMMRLLNDLATMIGELFDVLGE